jgi:hypothetical protein
MAQDIKSAIEQAKADEKRGFVFDKNYTVLKKAPEPLAGDYEVPGCVTLIASQAFAPHNTLAQLDKLESEGKVLKSVTIPESVRCIEFEAFSGCRLENVTIRPGLRIIASGAFYYCKALKRIALPETLEVLGHGVFGECENLREAALPESLRKVCSDTFESTPIEKSALEGIPADKIIPAWDGWEDQELMRLDDMDTAVSEGHGEDITERGGCDGVMEWSLKYIDCDELVPYEEFLDPRSKEDEETADARLEASLKAHLDAMAKGGKMQ